MHKLSINTQGIWKPLCPGDQVDIIAPARQGKEGELALIHDFLDSWGLKAHIPEGLLGEDLLCANSDEKRLQYLSEALYDSDAAAIWCLRGGYGCTRLMPEFIKLAPSPQLKWFMGFSDITVLHSWLNQSWHWPSLHAPSLRQLPSAEVDELSMNLLKGLLFGEEPTLNYELVALNNKTQAVQATISGGNLCLIENSIGTPWQMDCRHKIILIEEVGEVAYRVDRSLNHLVHAGLFNETAAIILGDFSNIDPQEEKIIDQVLALFAEHCSFPVYRLRGIGHGSRNMPVPLGIQANIKPL